MTKPMMADISRQPTCLRQLLDREGEISALAADAFGADGDRQLTSISCGDGWFASRAVADAAVRGHSIRYRAATSLEYLTYHAGEANGRDRVIGISMSGNVDRTIEAVRAAQEAGAGALALVNGEGGRLGQLAAKKLSLDIPDIAPFLCGTSSYTATLLTLLLLLRGAGHNPAGDPRWAPDLVTLRDHCSYLPEVIGKADRFMREVVGDAAAKGISGVRFLSAGPNLATADYGAAKLVELTRTASWSDDVEEFAHRQFWTMDQNNLVIYLSANPTLAKYASESADSLSGMGVMTVSIEVKGSPVTAATHRLILPEMPEWLSPIVMAIPLQLLGYHLAYAQGLDPNTRQHLKDDNTRFVVSRKLTRRSLIGKGL